MGLLNLEEQLIFYGQYHSNKVNILIHIVCVPLILWSALVWASSYLQLSSYGDPTSLWHLVPFVPNLALYVVLFYIGYYILLEPVAGLLYSSILLYMAYSATNFAATYPNHNTLALYVHVACWIAQFAGHGFAEKRSPALIHNVSQALLLAPLFVWLELLFFFGYRPALQQRVEAKVQLAIAELKKKKGLEEKSVE